MKRTVMVVAMLAVAVLSQGCLTYAAVKARNAEIRGQARRDGMAAKEEGYIAYWQDDTLLALVTHVLDVVSTGASFDYIKRSVSHYKDDESSSTPANTASDKATAGAGGTANYGDGNRYYSAGGDISIYEGNNAGE